MSQPVALQTSAGGGGVSAPSPSGDTSRPQMQKAALTLYDATPSGLGGQRGAIPFQFNPKEVSIQKGASWKRDPATAAKTAGPVQFTGSEPCKLTMEMFFDASDKQDGSVVESVEKLFSCTVPTQESTGREEPLPPLVVLHWGAITSFPAFVTSVSAKYTLFTPDGLPIRASCSVSLEEMPTEHPKQNPTSGSDSVRRSHTMVEGDSLASVAFAEYGDPAAWRDVARFNGLDDPIRCTPGTRLLLPSPEEL